VEEIYDVRALISKIFTHHKERMDNVFFPSLKVKRMARVDEKEGID
jgi:hypothetical protein